MPEPLRVFVSYSHKDEDLKDELETHVALLKRQGLIAVWHDRRITGGAEWKGEIDAELEAAHIVLLLVSPAFVASDYCYDKEMTRAMERHEAGTARVVPIIVRPADWTAAPFAKLQALPRDGKPVTLWGNRDEAWLNVAKGLRQVVEVLQKQGAGGGSAARAAAATPAGAAGAQAAGGGSPTINIGGNVTGSVIVQGNGNQVGTGGGKPDPER